MNLKKMTARVMRALPNLPPNTIGTNNIVDLLNEGLENLASMSNKTTTLVYAVEEDTDSVYFPSDMLRLVNVYWSDDKTELEASLEKTPKPYLDEDDDEEYTGTPIYYYVEDGRIVLRPIPNEDENLYVVYTRKPTTMTNDTDEPDLEGAEEYMIAYALYRLHLEANSPSFQLWDMERTRALAVFTDVHDGNYQTPFRVIPTW